ncbi:MAG: hypothetical protein FWE83_09480 [Oscillospiraceae bacterium]|nr:hypothetical protein [Oscillospiraceae bacterium]
MKVQIINYSGKIGSLSERIEFTISTINEPKSLDEHDINIIDLSDKHLWKFNGNQLTSIDDVNDLISLKQIIARSKISKIIIIFPDNITLLYNKSNSTDKYWSQKELKDCLDFVNKIFSQLIPKDVLSDIYLILFEPTTTEIDKLEYSSSFIFDKEENPLTKSRSAKVTSKKVNNQLFLTTMNILESEEHLFTSLERFGLISVAEEYPQWLLDYKILNDKELYNEIEMQTSLINSAEIAIITAKERLTNNMELKSIVFTTGNQLVKGVFRILENVLDIDLSSFVDINKDDFNAFVSDDFDIVGEIKGLGSNVKSRNIAQVRTHRIGYMEELEEQGIKKDVKALLIINPLRDTPVNKREPIHQTQIDQAFKDEVLIIETVILLKIYELSTTGKMKPDVCTEMLRKEKGLLTEKIIKKYAQK